MKITKTQLEEMKNNGLILEGTDLSNVEVVEDDAFISEAQQEKVNNLVVGAKKKKEEQLQQQLEEEKTKLLEEQRKASMSEDEKVKARIEELNNEIEEIKKNTEQEKQALIINSKRIEFKNKMLVAGVDENLAQTIADTTNVDAMDNYDISLLPTKRNVNPSNVDDKDGKKTNSIIDLAKGFM